MKLLYKSVYKTHWNCTFLLGLIVLSFTQKKLFRVKNFCTFRIFEAMILKQNDQSVTRNI